MNENIKQEIRKEEENENNYFQKLFKINVNDKVEKKNGLTYLSWAYAWAEVKKLFPDANYTIYETLEGINYFTDGRTAWVKTGVKVNGIEHIEYLPIMDYKNKSIPLEQITSFDVNKTIQRSLTKAVARHGLGLYIYAGEDLPESDEEKEAKQTQSRIAKNKALENQDKENIKPQKKTPKNAEKSEIKDINEMELPFEIENEEQAVEDLTYLHDKIAQLNFDLKRDTVKCYEFFCGQFGVDRAEDLSKKQLEDIVNKLQTVYNARQSAIKKGEVNG